MKTESMPKRLKTWLVASIAVLLVSLVAFAATIVAGFYYFTDMSTPLWVSVVGAVSMFGMLVGFCGLFLVMILIAVKSGHRDGPRSV
jgi:hypothetical protein